MKIFDFIVSFLSILKIHNFDVDYIIVNPKVFNEIMEEMKDYERNPQNIPKENRKDIFIIHPSLPTGSLKIFASPDCEISEIVIKGMLKKNIFDN
jgi:uncharacterized linocin/CFP29 family protein